MRAPRYLPSPLALHPSSLPHLRAPLCLPTACAAAFYPVIYQRARLSTQASLRFHITRPAAYPCHPLMGAPPALQLHAGPSRCAMRRAACAACWACSALCAGRGASPIYHLQPPLLAESKLPCLPGSSRFVNALHVIAGTRPPPWSLRGQQSNGKPPRDGSRDSIKQAAALVQPWTGRHAENQFYTANHDPLGQRWSLGQAAGGGYAGHYGQHAFTQRGENVGGGGHGGVTTNVLNG